MTSVDLSSNLLLETIKGGYNDLSVLDIQIFPNLHHLSMPSCDFTDFDFSNNPLMDTINLFNNDLDSIDVSNLFDLKFLSFNNSNIDEIDLSNNDDLIFLSVSSNSLDSIDLSNLYDLQQFYASSNSIDEIDFSNNPLLELIYMQSNGLEAVDVSNLPDLRSLNLGYNNIDVLNAANNPLLEYVSLAGNDFINLDLSSNSVLNNINIVNNPFIEALNIANGNNVNFVLHWFSLCPNLSCIQVDDVAFADTNFTLKDATTSYSLDCAYCFESYANITTSICAGESFISRSLVVYTMTGNYYDTIPNTCGGDSIITINLTVNDMDSISLVGEDFCTGTTVDFYGTTISSTGTYFHTLVNQNGCDSIVSKSFNELENTIVNNNGTLEATPGFDTYQWFESGLSIVSANTITFTPTESGDYSCEAIKNTCILMSNAISIVIDTTGTAIRQMAFNNLQVYPNPTKDLLNIDLKEKLTSINLVTITGKLINEYKPESRQIDLGNLESGIYLLEITNETKHAVISIVKQ